MYGCVGVYSSHISGIIQSSARMSDNQDILPFCTVDLTQDNQVRVLLREGLFAGSMSKTFHIAKLSRKMAEFKSCQG